MIDPENINPVFALVTAGVLWIAVIVGFLYKKYEAQIEDFFAHRRHMRRERNRMNREMIRLREYAKNDVQASANLYKENTPRLHSLNNL